ncbi:MAG: hypothetical protein MR611_01630 [Coriobacteriaceae bacterium]|nr:hypothetical protein [Coriobacteriaceae bacterium]
MRVLVPVALVLPAVVVVAVSAFMKQGNTPSSSASKSQSYTLNFMAPNYSEDADSKISL